MNLLARTTTAETEQLEQKTARTKTAKATQLEQKNMLFGEYINAHSEPAAEISPEETARITHDAWATRDHVSQICIRSSECE